MKNFDITIIGGGESGYSAASQAADLGAKVCLIEKEYLGGTFLNSGVFTLRKILTTLGFYPSSYSSKDLAESHFKLDVKKAFEKANQLKRAYSEKWEINLKEKGVHIEKGEGSFAGSKNVEIKTPNQTDLISTEKIILATGSETKHPETIPFDGKTICPLESLGEFLELPEKILIVDGGAQGAEAASLMKILGCKPFLCEQNSRVLQDEDSEVMDYYEEQVRKKRLKIILNKKIVSIYKRDGEIDVSLDGGIKFPVSKIFFGGVRAPSSKALNIQTSEIRLGEHEEILVDEKMQTSLPGVFAIGSVTRQQRVAHRNFEEAKVAVYNCLGKSRSLNLDKIPSIIYSDPQFASIGCHFENAHYKGFRAIGGGAIIDGPDENGTITQKGLFKLTIDKESKKMIGAQVVAQNASEIIPVLHLAFKKGLTLKDLSNLSFGAMESTEPIIKASRKILTDLKTSR
jgi:dihydrolipoamide dehydrogenase